MKQFDTYKEAVENIKIGDHVTFSRKDSFLKENGEVVDFHFLNERFFIKIYSFYKRKIISYILTENLELAPIRKKRKKKYEPANLYDSDEEQKAPLFIKRLLIKTVSVILIVSFILLYYPHTFFLLFSPSLKYEKFLENDYSLGELFHVVTSRMIYQSDIAGDYWDTPEYAWNKQSGDCEEFASICADYLTHHKIENYLVGLQTRDPNIGHAVVFVKLKDDFYIIDPTEALEGSGVRKIDNCKNLHDAVKQYSILPCEVYKVPTYENEKKIISYIY
jgi:hypothetical protein